MKISFFIAGDPRPAGSKRGIPIYKGSATTGGRVFSGRVAVVDSSEKSQDWKATVYYTARIEFQKLGIPLLTCPLSATFEFLFKRPAGHYGSGRNEGTLKASAPAHHTHAPDVLKLTRAVEDALKGAVYADDSLIVDEIIRKRYVPFHGAAPGVLITIETL